MIYVNIFNITPDNKNIQVSVETSEGDLFTSAKFKKYNTYSNETEYVDLDYKLKKIDSKEVFYISSNELDLNDFSGIFFLELTSSSDVECADQNCDITTAVTANFNNIKSCILDKVLSISDCEDIYKGDGYQDAKSVSIINLNLLLESLCIALGFGHYIEAISIYKSLLKLCGIDNECSTCNSCNSCGNIEDPKLFTGLGYGILNNNLMLV